MEAFALGSDLRQAIWTAFDKNGNGNPFQQGQVYPMEWPPSKDQTLRLGGASNALQAEESIPEDTLGSSGETP